MTHLNRRKFFMKVKLIETFATQYQIIKDFVELSHVSHSKYVYNLNISLSEAS